MENIDDLLKAIDERISFLEKREFYDSSDDEFDISLFDNLIGLDNVKSEVQRLVSYLSFLNKVNDKTMIDSLNLNMIFSGNPGTGKTTVARLVAKMLYSMGFIKKNVCAEVTVQDFVAGYIGQTSIKSRKLLDKYRGGVIFIDEAYAFNNDNNGFASDAIVEIIKEMEKKETVFVFAGYKSEMNEFVEINPGLRSRVGYEIDFADYSADELTLMFVRKLNSSNLRIMDDATKLVKDIFESYGFNSGNGRLVDNLYNKILLEHAIRTEQVNDVDDLLTISVDDIKVDNLFLKKKGDYFA